ncbi:MAG: hypothetical protein QW230_03610, partial [Thermofilum sp.]
DGGAVELIKDNVNGWLFGVDLRDLTSLSSAQSQKIDESEYAEMKAKFSNILAKFRDERNEYMRVSLSAVLTFAPRVSMDRVMREYYPDMVR